MAGVETIPIRIPEKWDRTWFEGFIRDVLANADARNAIGAGVAISGSSDGPATITGAGADASFIVVAANTALTDERVLDVETGVLTKTDNGAGNTFEIGVATGGLAYAKIQDISATDKLLGRSSAGAGVIEEITCTAAGRALIDDTNAAAQRTTLGVDPAGTDNSTDVTLAGTLDYITIAGQVITRNAIDLTTDVTGAAPVANGGTGATTAANARINLGLAIGSDVQAWDADLDTYAANPLTAAELTQLQNIGTEAISAAEWAFLAAMDQGVATTDSVNFVDGTFSGMIKTGAGATGSRPTPLGAGTMWFDTTLGIPIWHDGTNWIDATGTTV